jgi:carbon-monoxide dehydrogenase large subunit
VLAGSKVRYAGEPIAVVAAEDAYSAADAAAATEVALDPLPAVVDVEAAAADDAPMLHEELGTNRPAVR